MKIIIKLLRHLGYALKSLHRVKWIGNCAPLFHTSTGTIDLKKEILGQICLDNLLTCNSVPAAILFFSTMGKHFGVKWHFLKPVWNRTNQEGICISCAMPRALTHTTSNGKTHGTIRAHTPSFISYIFQSIADFPLNSPPPWWKNKMAGKHYPNGGKTKWLVSTISFSISMTETHDTQHTTLN